MQAEPHTRTGRGAHRCTASQVAVLEAMEAKEEHRLHEEDLEVSRRSSVMPVTSLGTREQAAKFRYFHK